MLISEYELDQPSRKPSSIKGIYQKMSKFSCVFLASILYFISVFCEEEIYGKSHEKDDDSGRVDPECLKFYSNKKCSQQQRDEGDAIYRAIRLQELQTILSNYSTSISKSASSPIVSTLTESKNLTSSLAGNLTTNFTGEVTNSTTQNSSSTSNSTSSFSSTTEATSSSNLVPLNSVKSAFEKIRSLTGYSACDRAYRLLQVADLFTRYNALCQARIFGIAANPDYWIKKCREAVNNVPKSSDISKNV